MAAARGFLLGTTALAGAGLLSVPPALAAEARPGGALDVTVTGFVRFLATGGDLDNARLDDTISTGLDFLNDTEVHLVLAGRNDATGLEYGGKVELEADTSATASAVVPSRNPRAAAISLSSPRGATTPPARIAAGSRPANRAAAGRRRAVPPALRHAPVTPCRARPCRPRAARPSRPARAASGGAGAAPGA
jgi:hypothetical protein